MQSTQSQSGFWPEFLRFSARFLAAATLVATAFSGAAQTPTNEFQFSSPFFIVQENTPGFVVVNVLYGGGASNTVTVDYATSDGSATNLVHYVGVTNTLSFSPGETNKSFTVTILDNAAMGGNRTINLVLQNPTGGAVVSPPGTATVIIADDESPPNQPPANDNFTNAANLIGIAGSFSGTNVFATLEPAEPIHGGVTGGASVWFRWTAPASGTVVFSTSGSTFFTTLAAYTGTSVNGLTVFASDNPFFGGVFGLARQITFSVVAGTVYYIAVDGVFGSVGNYVLSWSMAGSAGVFGFTASTYQSAEFENSDRDGATLDRSIPGARITFNRSGGLTGKVRLTYLVTNGTNTVTNINNLNALYNLQYIVPDPGTGIPNGTNVALGGVTNSVVFFHGQGSQSFLIDPLAGNGVLANPFGVANNGTASLGIQILSVELDPTESTAIVPPTIDPARRTSRLFITDAQAGANFFTARSRTTEGVGTMRILVNRGAGIVDDQTTRFHINDAGFGSGAGTPNNSGFPTDAGADYATPVTNFVNTSGILVWIPSSGDLPINIPIPDNPVVGFNNEFFIELYNDSGDNAAPLGASRTNFVTILVEDRVTGEHPAGSVDPAWNRDFFSGTTPPFNATPGANNIVISTAVQADGKSLFGGDFTSVNTITRNRIVRMNTNGQLDTAFDPGAGANRSVNAIQLQADNKILIGGAFSSVAGSLRGGVARLNTNGSLDASFSPGVGANATVRSLAAYTNGANQGRVVVVGDFTSFAGASHNRIVRLNSDGSVDTGFNTGSGANGPVHVAKIQLDGKVVIGGNFTAVNGVTRNRIARLTSTGALDPTFDPGPGADGVINAVALDRGAVSLSNTVINVSRSAQGGAAEDIFDLNFSSAGPPGSFFNGALTINFDFLAVPDYMNVYLGTNQTPTNRIFQTGVISGANTVTIPFGPTTNTILRIVMNEGNNTNFGTVWFYDATLVAGTGDISSGAEKLVIGGEFNNYDVRASSKIARVNANGSLDTSFNVGTGADDTVFAIEMDTNNRAVFGGLFTSYNGTRRVGMARLRTDGALDTVFMDAAYNQFAGLPTTNSPLSQPKNYVRSISLQSDGNVMIGGSFKQVGGGGHNTTAFGTASPWGPNVSTPSWISRDDIRNRYNMARMVVGTNDGPGNIGFTQSEYSTDESAGFTYITVSRTNGGVGQVNVQFTTGDRPAGPGAAISGTDYVGLASTVTYVTTHGIANDTRRLSDARTGPNNTIAGPNDIFIIVNDDGLVEGNEQLTLSLDVPTSGMFLGGEFIPLGFALGNSQATLRIIDDDLPPTFVGFLTNSYIVDENAGFATITAIRTGNTAGSVSVNYQTFNGTALDGSDHIAVFGSLTFGNGETNRTFNVPIINDSVAELDETVSLVLTNLSVGASFLPGGNHATLTIFDNDFATGQLRFSATNYTVAENGGSVEVTVQRTGGNVGAITAQVFTFNDTATSPADYASAAATLNWANGDSSPRLITVPVAVDGLIEGPETFFVQLTNARVVANGTPVPVAGVNPVPVVILDSDAYGTLQFASSGFSVNENGGTVLVTVTRLGGSSGNVQANFTTADGTGTAGVEYVPTNGTITLGPGVTSANFAVGIIDNSAQNPGPNFNRTVVVGLNTFSNGTPGLPTTALLTIVDDENINEPAGSVDTSFNASAGANGFIYTLSLQPDGRLLIGGDFSQFNGVARRRVARLDAGGSLDTVFNPPGGASDSVRAILAQPDGRVLVAGFFTNVAGTARNRYSRLNADGTTDSSFDPGAGADGPVFALAQHADTANVGKIIVAGGFAAVDGVNLPFVARLNTNGSVDAGFNTGVGPNAVVFATAVQPDGRVLIGGDFLTVDGQVSPRLARLNANGSLDTSFSANLGLGFSESVRAVLVQTDGRILVGGLFTNFNGVMVHRLARLNADGTVDGTFLPNSDPAAGGDNSVLALALQPDGKIIVAGDFQHFSGVTRSRLTRLNADGTVDPAINFGIGANNFVASGLVQLNDGKIVIGGGFTSFNGLARNYLARLYGGVIAGAGQVEFASSAYTVSELQTNLLITVTRTGGTAGSISVNYATANGTATSGQDYLGQTNSLFFTNAEVIATFSLALLDDSLVEGNETVNFTLSTNLDGSSGTTLGNQPVSTLTIVDDDSYVSFSSASYVVNEAAAANIAPIILVRSGSTNGTFTVTLVTSNLTATAGADYTAVSNTVTFLPGELSRTINIPILEDALAEGDETVALYLVNLFGAASLTAPSTATLTVVDNDFFPGQLSFLAPAFFVDENATNALITVVRSNGSSGSVTVNFSTADGTALAGADYVATNGSLFFADGETNKTFKVGIKTDMLIELDETLLVVLSNATGGASLVGANPATLTINNNNEFIFGSFRLASDLFTVSEGAGSATITVVRTGGTTGTSSVEFGTTDGGATTNQDYLATNGTLVFLPGQTSRTFTVPILTDNLVETNETVILTLSNAVGGASIGPPTNALLTIISTNIRPGDFTFLMPVFSGLENAGPVTITVLRTNGTTGNVSVGVRINDATAHAGVDYVGTNGGVISLSWADGDATPQTFTITPIDDPLVEAPETVLLTLQTPFGDMGLPVISSPNATLTIIDNEVPAGSLDTSFPVSADGTVYGVARDDGNLKIIAGGDFTQLNGIPRAKVGRFDLFGILDAFAVSGISLSGGSASVRAVAVYGPGPQAGKIVAVGQFDLVSGFARTNVVRLNTDGSVDPGFDPASAPNGVVHAVVANNDGSVILGGAFTQVGTNARPFLARLSTDGSLDTNFNPGAGPDGVVRALASQIDGKLVFGGDFTNVATTVSPRVARLNADSSVDTAFSFNLGLGADAPVFAVNVDANGSIYLGGAFSNFNNSAAMRLARLKNDGTRDTSFNALGTGFNDTVLALATQPDGKPVVCGEFTSFNGLPLNRLARLQTNGAVDVSINFGTGANGFVHAVTLQPDGKLIIGGGFTQINGNPAPFLARLNGGENIGSGVLEFTQTNFNVAEFAGNSVISVVRFGGASNLITVPYATADLSAQAGLDYASTTGVLTFQPGETLKTFVVPILNDTLVETNELVGLQLGAPTGGATLGNATNSTLTILEDDSVVGFAGFTFVANENVGLATVIVIRTGGSAGSVTVDFSTADGSALASGPNPDYVATNGTVTFAPGETNKTFSVALLDDALIEATESIALLLSNPTGATVLGQTTANLLIVDNDVAAGVFTLADAAYQTNEMGGSVTVTVVRTNGSSGAASVTLSTVGGTATPDVDYTPVNLMLTFADGESVKSLQVFILNDQIAEPTEFVNLLLSNPTGGAGLGAITNAPLTILDEDTSFEFSAANYLATESGILAVVTVNRVGSNVLGATVRARTLTTAGSTATEGVDYLPVDTLLVFDPGNASQSFTVVLLDDQLIETNEIFGLQLYNPVGATLGPQSISQVTIVDDDNAISFTDASYTTNEASTIATITLLRTGNLGTTSAVTYAVFDGTASNGLDFVGTTNIVTFSPGQTNASFDVVLLPDTVVESSETINLALLSATNGAFVGALSNATLTILDDDVAGSLLLSSAAYVVGEGDGFASITVLRTNGTSGTVSANFNTADGTATAIGTNADYAATNGVVVFADGETNKSFLIQITNDTRVEADETVLVFLSNPAGGASLGSITNATLTITNEDFFGALQFTSSGFSVSEGIPFASVTVSRVGGSAGAVSVNFATGGGSASVGTDYTTTNGVLNWADGDIADKTILVAIANDSLGEPDETVNLTLSNPGGGASLGSPVIASLTIVDDDLGVAFSSDSYTVNEAAGLATITISRLGVAGGAVSVSFGVTGGTATPGVDYTNVAGSLTWADGDLSPKTFTIPIINDAFVEGDETVALALSNVVGASLSAPFEATLTIVDDDSSTTFLPAGARLLSESGGVTNGVIEPGETVTLSLALRNVGSSNSTNLVGTLLNSNGVTPVTISSGYGVVIAGGPAVARDYTFIANGTNGGTITAVLQMQDGAVNQGAVPFVFGLGSRTNKFANTNSIAILDSSPASAYPSTINVIGVAGNVSRLTVTLSNLAHTFPADIDILLVSPTGQKMILMSDCGGTSASPNPISDVTLTFDDTAATNLGTNQMVSGTNKPTNLTIGGADFFPPPAPLAPYASTLAAFDGVNPNGVWSLYIIDDNSIDSGTLAGGWCLSFIESARVNPLGDLNVSVTDSPDPAIAGLPVTYTLVVSNAGASTARNVVLTNVLPAGLSYAAITNTNGSFFQTGATVIFQLGTIASGGARSATVVANTTGPGSFSDNATVTSSLTDSPSANNSAAAVTTVFAAADLGIALSDSPDPVVLGNNFMYFLVVTNRGPSTASGVVVINTLPSGVNFVSVVSSQGGASHVNGVVTANLGTLAGGAGATVTITARPTALGTITDSGSVAAAETDLNTDDNFASVKTTVISSPPTLTQSFGAGNLTLSWPSSASNFELEYTGSITPPVVWTPMPISPSVVGSNLSVTIPVDPLTPARFYRLKLVP